MLEHDVSRTPLPQGADNSLAQGWQDGTLDEDARLGAVSLALDLLGRQLAAGQKVQLQLV